MREVSRLVHYVLYKAGGGEMPLVDMKKAFE